MLSIGKLRAGQQHYYLTSVAAGADDYGTGAGEATGAWLGIEADRLGVQGPVTADGLRHALAGRHPDTGAPLTTHARANRVPGWDLTFSAPKSVSVLYGLADEATAQHVADAHHHAVATAVRYLEHHAVHTRQRRNGTVEHVRGEGLLVAAFTHRTSRSGDPQLHTHCLAANLVERVNGGFGALHSTPLYHHASTAGHVYQAILRAELTHRLGVLWTPITKGTADIDGLPQALLELFSKRRADIDHALADTPATPAAARLAALTTRPPKDPAASTTTLAQRWRAEAAAIGVDPDQAVPAVRDHPRPTLTEHQVQAAVDELVGAHGLTERDAWFERRAALRAWCSTLTPGVAVDLPALEALTDLLLDDNRVVALNDPDAAIPTDERTQRPDGRFTTAAVAAKRWSTVDMLRVEQRLIEQTVAGRNQHHGPPVGELDDADLASLSAEQADVATRLTRSTNTVDLLVGRAGTGKTYTLAAADRVWRAAGYQPIALAVAARAANHVQTTTGIPATTLAQFLTDADCSPMPVLHDRHVVIVDEAGMADTRSLARLADHTHRAGARLVLVGDHHQLPAVNAGGAFAALAPHVDTLELTENRRQVEQWERDTLDRVRTGVAPHDTVHTYRNHGRVHLAATPGDARRAMVAAWYAATGEGTKAAMLALRRHDVAELNRRARVLLVADGTLPATGARFGDKTFAVGDRVVCLANDRRVGVHNGAFGTVTALNADDRSLNVAFDDATSRTVPAPYVSAGHLDHGYATTIHKAQGATYDRALLLGDDTLYRQAAYTALSRGRAGNDLFLVAHDDRDLPADFERHGTEDDDADTRIVRSLVRDRAKTLAIQRLQDTPAGTDPSLADLYRRQVELSTGPAEGEDLRRLDAEISLRTIAAGYAAEIDRPHRVVALIGDPPVSLTGRDEWRQAAAAIESYWEQWGSGPADPSADEAHEHRLAVLAVIEALHDPTPPSTSLGLDE